tara:strand:- start:24 stop:458 length:435 start_codon:yes stop_codon:yes gene_type:complete
MFAEFDDTMFPNVHINLKFDNINQKNFTEFTQKWETYDERNTPYTFIFTSEGVGLKLTKYIKKIVIFIKKLKKRKKIHNNVFLSKSIMICKNNFTKYLLKCIFTLQKPLAPVYIIENENYISKLCDNIAKHPKLYDSNVSAYFP